MPTTETPLRRLMFEKYNMHYKNVGFGYNHPQTVGARYLRGYERTYGHLVARLPPGSRVLDLGCGNGILIAWLRQYHPSVRVVGIDVCPGQIDEARQCFPGVELHVSDACQFLRQNTNSFSAIFSFDVLEHLTEDHLLETMDAALESLVPEGFFCCRVPNAANLFAAYSRYMDVTHCRLFTSPSIIQLYEAIGFRDIRIVPIKHEWWKDWIRLRLEHMLHWFLFRICGRFHSEEFTKNISCVGFRPKAETVTDKCGN